MGLFSKKAKKVEFPEFPSLPPKLPELPRYESPLKESEEEVQIPIRRPMFEPLPPMRMSMQEMEEPVARSSQQQPVYVKLAKYKEAVSLIKEINTRLQEAENILAQLSDIKSKEDAEIEKWQEELASIKNKLMEVDKNLFGA